MVVGSNPTGRTTYPWGNKHYFYQKDTLICHKINVRKKGLPVMLRVLVSIVGAAAIFTIGYLTGRFITKKYTRSMLRHELALFYNAIIQNIKLGKESRERLDSIYATQVPDLEPYERNDFQ